MASSSHGRSALPFPLELTRSRNVTEKFVTPSAVTLKKDNLSRSFDSTLSARKSSRAEAPRDLSGSDLAQALHKLGYSITRKTGSQLRLTTQEQVSIDDLHHTPLRIGALSAILADVATHLAGC